MQPDRFETRQAQRSYWLYGAIALTIVLVVVLLVFVANAAGILGSGKSGGHIGAPVVVVPTQDGMGCLRDVVWSPDGKQIALAGTKGQCPTATTASQDLILIEDAATGRMVHSIAPDSAIRAALPTSQNQLPIVALQLLWSPDGQRLALTFATLGLPTIDAQAGSFVDQGLLVSKYDGSDARAYVTAFDATTPNIEWDTNQGTASGLSAATATSTVPVGLTYHWDTNGNLVPDTPLTPSSPAVTPTIGPVGNAVGSTQFSIWQTGAADIFIQVARGGQHYAPGIFDWEASFGAWSPDGHYLIAPVDITGRLQPAGAAIPSDTILQSFNLADLPLLPVRDAGMQQILQQLQQAAAGTVNARAAVAWRPDGRVVAGYGDGFDNVLTLYACSDGRTLATLTPQAGPQPLEGIDRILRWSPDGSHLAIATTDAGTITIWAITNLG